MTAAPLSTSPGVEAAARARSPARQIAALGFPLLLGALSSSVSGIVDTAMMGRYGTAQLAAVSGTSAVFDVFANLVLASLIGFQILAPRFVGRGDPLGLRRALRASIGYAGGLAALLTLACLLAGRQLTGLVSGPGAQLRDIGAGYLAARAPTLLLLVPFTLLAAYFNAHKQARHVAAAGLAVNLVNLLLDALLIFGPGPFPRWGAVGNGLATTVAWAVGVAWLAVAARRGNLRSLLSEPSAEPPAPAGFVTSIPRLIWPAMVSSGLDYASMAVFFAILGTIGEAALAGGRIAFEVTVLLFGIGMSFAAASRILIGRALGSGDRSGARANWRTGQRLLLGPGVVLGVLLAVLPRYAAMAFTSYAPVLDSAADVMPIVGLCVPLIAWTLGNVSVIRALGHTRADMNANLAAALAVQLPLGWVLADEAGLGVTGAFLGVLGYWLSRAVLTEIAARRMAPA
jgi:MATE family multidrug resistance protein